MSVNLRFTEKETINKKIEILKNVDCKNYKKYQIDSIVDKIIKEVYYNPLFR